MNNVVVGIVGRVKTSIVFGIYENITVHGVRDFIQVINSDMEMSDCPGISTCT